MAGIPRTNTIISDSAPSSSSPLPSQAEIHSDENASNLTDPPPAGVKRVGRTYGRAKADIPSGSQNFYDSSLRARILKTSPRDADNQVIPESDGVDERIASFDGSDWRAKLRAIDEDYSGTSPATIANLTAPGGSNTYADSQSNLASGEPSGPSASQDHRSRSDDDGNENEEQESMMHLSNRNVITSPEGSDSQSSSPRNVYPINTPRKQSSPTPPTSPLVEKSAAEKTVNSVEYSGESGHTATSEASRRGDHKGKRKDSTRRNKAPTKKDIQEIQKESARLLADQHISIRRSDPQPVHTIGTFFNMLKDTVPQPLKQDSDPIMSFSSPSRTSSAAPHATSADACASVLSKDARKNENDSDDDIPELEALPQDNLEKRDHMDSDQMECRETKARENELGVRKRKALERVGKAKSGSMTSSSEAGAKLKIDSDSDDLEIVEDIVGFHVPPLKRIGKSTKPPTHRSQATVDDGRVPAERPNTFRSVSHQNLELAAKPSFIRTYKNVPKEKRDIHVSHSDLNNIMMLRVNKQNDAIEEKKKEEWVKAGGSLKERKSSNLLDKSISDWLQEGSIRENAMEYEEDDKNEESMPKDTEAVELEPLDVETRNPDENISRHNLGISDEEPNTDTDKENHRPTRRRSGRVLFDSDEDDASVEVFRSSTSRTVVLPDTSFSEDDAVSLGEDKENCTELAFDDLNEDKENALVRGHFPYRGGLNTSEYPEPLRDRNLIGAGREPFTDLDIGDDSAMPPSEQPHDSSRGRILQVLHEEQKNSPSSAPTSPEGEFLHRRTDSPGSDEHVDGPRPLSYGGFSQLFAGSDNETDSEEAPATALGENKFSQFFSPGESTSKSTLKSKNENPFLHLSESAKRDDEFQFTQPVALLPSVRISGSQRREVDEMFGKDQEFKLDEANRTRMEGKSSKRSVPGSLDLQGFQSSQTSPLSPHSIRRPLEILSLGPGDAVTHLNPSSQVTPSRHEGRLLRRPSQVMTSRSSSPLRRNAFDVLREGASKAKREERTSKPHLEKSDFIEAEAQESDEEAMIGFGGRREDDEDDPEDQDQDAIVEGLVDDAVMDAHTEAADLVLEKHMEHQAADDAALQKLHQDAIDGKLRGKRRDRGLGFEDSDSEDEEYRGPRKPSYKKRRIEGDTLESYGKIPETKAFYDLYQADLMEDADPRLNHLKQSDTEEMQDDDNPTDQEQGATNFAEGQRRPKELTRSEVLRAEAKMDFGDVSWMESRGEDTFDGFEIEERAFHHKKVSEPRLPLDHLDHRAALKGKKADSTEEAKLKSWANREARKQSSASGRGGFSRNTDGKNESARKKAEDVIKEISVAGPNRRTIVKNSSLISKIEKRKGFED